jgi:hypothetical protein
MTVIVAIKLSAKTAGGRQMTLLFYKYKKEK